MQCDVCKEDDLENLVKKTIEHFGQIDVLVSSVKDNNKTVENYDQINALVRTLLFL